MQIEMDRRVGRCAADKLPMKKRLIPWQRAALAHPHDVDLADEPAPTCLHLPAKDRSLILACGMGIAAVRRCVAKAEALDNT